MSQQPQTSGRQQLARRRLALGLAVSGSLLALNAHASLSTPVAAATPVTGAVIYNSADPSKATVALGVNTAGHLNYSAGSQNPVNASAMGLSYRFPDGSFRDATAPGCLCEGWGVAVTRNDGMRVAGFANQAAGTGGLTGGEFSASGTRATSQIGLADAAVVVTHAYGVSLAPNLFQGNITITNKGSSTVSDLVYRRAMDWDVPTTEFNEYVTHGGVTANLEANGGKVRYASDNGFANSDPRSFAGSIMSGTVNTDFLKKGASDHGSVFDFAFGNLAAGESRTFNIYYGAAENLASAMNALSTIHADVYSLGQSSGPGGANDDAPTFIFAFGGVGTIERGTRPDDPLLPIVDVGTGVYEFPAPVSRRWYDPPFAKGFAYSLAGGGMFTEIGITDGFGDLTVRLKDGTLLSIAAGGKLDLTALGKETDAFEILGLKLDTGAPGYDPLRAFPTFLAFSGSPDAVRMKPLLEDATVPVPGTLALLLTGIGLLARRRRQLH